MFPVPTFELPPPESRFPTQKSLARRLPDEKRVIALMIMCFTHHQYCLVHFFSFLSPILFPFLSLSKLFVIRPSLKAQETKKIRLLMGSNVGHKSCRPLTLVWQHRLPFAESIISVNSRLSHRSHYIHPTPSPTLEMLSSGRREKLCLPRE